MNMNLIGQHMKAKEVQERDRQEIRDLLLSILSSHNTKNLINVTDSRDIRPVDEIMGSIQTVSINPFHEGGRKAHLSRNCLTQCCHLRKKGLSRQDYGPFTRKQPSYHL